MSMLPQIPNQSQSEKFDKLGGAGFCKVYYDGVDQGKHVFRAEEYMTTKPGIFKLLKEVKKTFPSKIAMVTAHQKLHPYCIPKAGVISFKDYMKPIGKSSQANLHLEELKLEEQKDPQSEPEEIFEDEKEVFELPPPKIQTIESSDDGTSFYFVLEEEKKEEVEKEKEKEENPANLDKPEFNSMVLISEEKFQSKFSQTYYSIKFSELDRYPDLEETVEELCSLFSSNVVDMIQKQYDTNK